MRAILTGFGSTGDFEPFLALAAEMRRHGHQPVLAFLPQFAARAEAHGIEFVPIGPRRLYDSLQESIKLEMERGTDAGDHLSTYFAADILKMGKDLFAVCRNADVLICSAEWPVGRIIHEILKIPYVSVHLDCFDEEFAAASADIVRTWEGQLADVFNPFRRQFGLSPLYHMLTTDGNSPQLALFAMSDLMCKPDRGPAWPEHHHVTGFFFTEEKGWTPDPALVDFLAAGEPPVVFTFGSVVYESAETAELLLDVIHRVGCRAVLVHGWGNLFRARQLPPGVFATEFAHYSWLFPRAACVVQSAGAGATAWALRSGVPTVCIPRLWQHFSFASFANAYGCGPVVEHVKLSAERLSEAITEVLTDPRYRRAAATVGAHLAAEGGAPAARKLIEQWYGERRGLVPGAGHLNKAASNELGLPLTL